MADEQLVTPPAPTSPTSSSSPLVAWDASEYIQHQKPFIWHVGFVLVGVVVSALMYLILHDIFAIAVVVLMFVALFVYAVRKPDTLHYQINEDGIDIGPKHFPFSTFRSFGVLQGSAIPNITLEPLQRFSPSISMYCAPEDLQKIVEALARFLPQTEKQQDVIDKLTHYLRF